LIRFTQSIKDSFSIDDLSVALLSHIVSKQQNKELLLRIEDRKEQKSKDCFDKETIELLNLFNIEYSRIVDQNDNIKYHTQMAMRLLLDKKAFNCFCTDEALQKDKEEAKKNGKRYEYSGFCQNISDETKFHCNAPFVVRLNKPKNDIKFSDKIKGDLSFKPYEVDSVVILDHEKKPTNIFSSAVDDMLYDISTIIQSQNNLSNIPKQINIMSYLGYEKEINYIHTPNIINIDTEDRLPNIKSLIDQGYLPAAIANYLVLLITNRSEDIFTIEEAIGWFDIADISKEQLKFDIKELNKINKKYLNMIDELRLSKILGYADEDIGKLAKLYIQECDTISQIKENIQAIFSSKGSLEGFEKQFELIKSTLQTAPFIKDYEELLEFISKQTDLKDEDIMIPLYYIITGQKNGPKLDSIYPYIRNYLGEIIK